MNAAPLEVEVEEVTLITEDKSQPFSSDPGSQISNQQQRPQIDIPPQKRYKWIKKPYAFPNVSFEGEFSPPPGDDQTPMQYFKMFLMTTAWNTLQSRQICTLSQKMEKLSIRQQKKLSSFLEYCFLLEFILADRILRIGLTFLASLWAVYTKRRMRCRFCPSGYTRVECSKCKIGLCLNERNNCFMSFHTK